jgi:hypothetical protein
MTIWDKWYKESHHSSGREKLEEPAVKKPGEFSLTCDISTKSKGYENYNHAKSRWVFWVEEIIRTDLVGRTRSGMV